ncbi:hypothetical protein AMTR_s00109p00032070 [Amborella trichopoda]|uniref:PX domain-containing protein n=1 Tax=Amborella trichopoda TaxID=13333 RepID=W1NTP2_AMBTC|nr:hypothetical protein AMTR_s00109p00032070 [Amborella trichopoda]
MDYGWRNFWVQVLFWWTPFFRLPIHGFDPVDFVTSSSVWINIPAAVSVIILLRYISYDLDNRRRAVGYSKSTSVTAHSQKRPFESPKLNIEKDNWKRKVDSPPVEAAIEHFTRHLISEWVTDLWYSRITPDRDAPEELVQIVHGVIGEISFRIRDINLVDLLTRDIINLICDQLELYRVGQAKVGKNELRKLSADQRDTQLKLVLAAEDKLHPALFSAEAEHKVLQHLMEGLTSFTFRPEDLHCSFFRYTARELLACAVMRPVMNLASPKFINERIESFVLSRNNKADKAAKSPAQETSQSKSGGSSRTSTDHFSGFIDRSLSGVELVQFKPDVSKISSDGTKENTTSDIQKDAAQYGHNSLATIYPTRQMHVSNKLNPVVNNADSSQSRALPPNTLTRDGKRIQTHRSGGEWGQMLDVMSKTKTQALAPEHFENMWTKGRDYKKLEGTTGPVNQVSGRSSAGFSESTYHSLKGSSECQIQNGKVKVDASKGDPVLSGKADIHVIEGFPVHPGGDHGYSMNIPHPEKNEHDHVVRLEEVELASESSYSEDDDNNNITGLDSPGTKVWDSKNKRNGAGSLVRHPLESSDGTLSRRSGKAQVRYPRVFRSQSGGKKSRSNKHKLGTWQEVERTSFLLGDGQDILNASKETTKSDASSDDNDPELQNWGRVSSGATASSSSVASSVSEVSNPSLKSSEISNIGNPFFKLRCEVLGANLVKSGAKSFAVYSIAVTDADYNSWTIKRRFRHFEELHRRLKEFPEYNLSLPPKHFLSSGLDVYVVHERCKLLDKYLKSLLLLPRISGSIEVWDFLSVDSQTYMFSNSLSIIQTLSVDLEDKSHEKHMKPQSCGSNGNNQVFSAEEHLGTARKESLLQMDPNPISNRPKSRASTVEPAKLSPKKHESMADDHSGSDSDSVLQKNVYFLGKSERAPQNLEKEVNVPRDSSQLSAESVGEPAIPIEWVPPNLSVPILDLVEVIFQLQDGGWIRRQAFWVAKQVLQLGMGDAFDDWLIDKIQLLRKGSVIALGIKRIEEILWPDGIFLSKHPKRQRSLPPKSLSTPTHVGGIVSPKKETEKIDVKDDYSKLEEHQQLEAARRAKFVRELMIDHAPAALVSLFGRKEYESCAQDLYSFLQSALCIKQLAYNLLELLLLATFPELNDVVSLLHSEKDRFGEVVTK